MTPVILGYIYIYIYIYMSNPYSNNKKLFPTLDYDKISIDQQITSPPILNLDLV